MIFTISKGFKGSKSKPGVHQYIERLQWRFAQLVKSAAVSFFEFQVVPYGKGLEIPYFSGYFRSRWYFEAGEGNTMEQWPFEEREDWEPEDDPNEAPANASMYKDRIDSELGNKFFNDKSTTNKDNSYKVCNDAAYAHWLEKGYTANPGMMYAKAPREEGYMMEAGVVFVMDFASSGKVKRHGAAAGWIDRVKTLEKKSFRNYTDFTT